MKKTLVYILTFIFLFTFASEAYAGEVNVELTGSIDFEDEKISTFDSSKTISGTADEGAVIEITVYKRLSDDRLKEMDSYCVEVGESGLFSQPVDLYVGDNVIEFCASVDGSDNFEKEMTVTRKKKAIKVQLESGIYIPGGNSHQ